VAAKAEDKSSYYFSFKRPGSMSNSVSSLHMLGKPPLQRLSYISGDSKPFCMAGIPNPQKCKSRIFQIRMDSPGASTQIALLALN